MSKKLQKEIHLFIIWSKARYKEKDIINDIKKKFEILDIYNVRWSLEKFSENLSRFYGENLPKNSGKEKHCGKGPFKCIIVRDNNPIYDIRSTSKGDKVVNINLFDAKQLYRKWTGGGHKIHATDNINESKIQLMLLFGLNYDFYLSKDASSKEKNYENDLVGANGWNSFEEIFKVLNETVKYVILRNFGNLEQQLNSLHPDIDLLVENRNLVKDLLNGKPTTNKKYRVQYKVKVKNKFINFDLRYVGDNYYDIKFQTDILNNRVKYEFFYIPNNELLLYSLIYHVLIHKNYISPDYIEKIEDLFHKLNIHYNKSIFVDVNLLDFLLFYVSTNNYNIVEPLDLTVGFNTNLLYQKLFVKKTLKRYLNEKYIFYKSTIKFLLKKILNKLS